MPTGNSQVKALVKSMKQFTKFKAMGTYNLQCLTTHITPPNPNWRENIMTAVEDGVIDAIVAMLKAHDTSPEILASTTGALAQMSINKEVADKIAESGALEASLAAMLKINKSSDDKDALEQVGAATSGLLDKVGTYVPDAVISSSGGLEAILEGLQDDTNPKGTINCANLLDKITREKKGQDKLVEAGGLEAMVAACETGKKTHPDMILPLFRVMERVAANPVYHAKLQELPTVTHVVVQLERHADVDAVVREGGRLLAIIAKDNLKEALRILEDANMPPEAKEAAMRLLANLALQPENIDIMIKEGGIESLIQNFPNFSLSTKEYAAAALEKVAADDDKYAREIVNQGGIELFVKTINDNESQELSKASVLVLARLASIDAAAASEVDTKGGIKAVLDTYNKNRMHKGMGAAVMQFINSMCTVGYDTEMLLDAKIVPVIIKIMDQEKSDIEIQRMGYRSLEILMTSANANANQRAASQILLAEGPKVFASSMMANTSEGVLFGSTLNVFKMLVALDKKAKDQLVQAGCVEALVAAIYHELQHDFVIGLTNLNSGKKASDISELLKTFVDRKKVTEVAKNANLAKLDPKLLETLKTVTVFSIVSGFPALLVDGGIVGSITNSLKAVAQGSGSSQKEEMLAAFGLAIWAVCRTSSQALTGMLNAGLMGTLLSVIEKDPGQGDAVLACLRAVVPFVSTVDGKALAADGNVVELCGNALRSNLGNFYLANAAVSLLLAFATSDVYSTLVVRKGGVRQLNKMIADSSGTPDYYTPIFKTFTLFERLASVRAGDMQAQLVSQGTVTAVATGMAAYPNNRSLSLLGSRILSLLMNEVEVMEVLARVREGVDDLKTARPDPKTLSKLVVSTSTLGYLSLDKSYSTMLVNAAAPQLIVELLRVVKEADQGQASELAARSGYTCLGQMGSTLDMPGGVDAVNILLTALKSTDVTLSEKVGVVDGIKYMCKKPEAKKAFFKGGAVPIIVDLLKNNSNDEPLAMACLSALVAFTNDPADVKLVTDGGALMVAINLLKSNVQSMSSQVAERTLKLLSNMALGPDSLKPLMDAGIIDTIILTLSKQCGDGTDAQPRVLDSATSLLSHLAVDEPTINLIVKKGAVKKVAEVSMSSSAYMADASCMTAVAYLAETCSMVPSLIKKLNATPIVVVLISAIDNHPLEDELNASASAALSNLLGSDPETAKGLVDDMVAILNQLKSKPKDPLLAIKAIRACRNLSQVSKLAIALPGDLGTSVLAAATKGLGIVTNLPKNDNRNVLNGLLLEIVASRADGNEVAVIKTIVDTLRANMDDGVVATAGCRALGKMCSTNPENLKLVASHGGTEVVAQLAASDQSVMQEAAGKALDGFQGAVLKSPDAFRGDPMGIRALSDLIKALPPAALGTFLTALCSSEAGCTTLLDFTTTAEYQAQTPEAQNAIMDALALGAGNGLVNITNENQLSNLLVSDTPAALAILATSKIGDGVVAKTDEHNKVIKENIAASENPALTLAAINNLAQNDSKVVDDLVKEGKAQEIMQQIRDNPEDKALIAAGLAVLGTMVATVGLEESGLTEDDLREIIRYKDDPELKELVEPFNNALTDMNEDVKKEEIVTIMAEPEKPIDKLERVALLAGPMKDKAPALPLEIIKDTVDTFPQTEPLRLIALANALDALASNKKNRDAMIKAGLLEALAVGLSKNSMDREFVIAALVLLNKFSKNKELKAKLVKIGIIEIIIGIIQNFRKDDEVVQKGFLVLANLAFNNPAAVQEIEQYSGTELVRTAFNDHIDKPRLLRYGMNLLSNIMYGNEAYKNSVGIIVRQEVLEILQRYSDDANVFKYTARVMGNIANIDAHILWFVQNKAVAILVEGLNNNPNNKDVNQVAIEVIGNFASLDEEAEAEKIISGEATSVLDMIFVQGGAKKIIEVCEAIMESMQTDTAVLQSGLKTLGVILNNSRLAKQIIQMGLVRIGLKAIELYDSDPEAMDLASQILASVSYFQEALPLMEKNRGVATILLKMDSCVDMPEVMECLAETLKNMCFTETARQAVYRKQGVQTIIDGLEANLNQKRVVEETLSLLTRLAKDEEISEEIGVVGMNVIFEVFNVYKNDPELLVNAYRLLGMLAFAQKNLQVIVQYGGHNLLIQSVLEFPEYQDLVVRSIQTLDNIAMADVEHSTIVTEAGGLRTIEEVINAYQGDPKGKKLIEVCKSALLSMQRGSTPDNRINHRNIAKQPSLKNDVDPLKDYRTAFKAGSVFSLWTGTSSKKRHMTVNVVDKTIMFKHPDPKKGDKGALAVPLSDIKSVKIGKRDFSKKCKADARTCFSIGLSGKPVCLEAKTATEMNYWFAAFELLVDTYRNNRIWVEPK